MSRTLLSLLILPLLVAGCGETSPHLVANTTPHYACPIKTAASVDASDPTSVSDDDAHGLSEVPKVDFAEASPDLHDSEEQGEANEEEGETHAEENATAVTSLRGLTAFTGGSCARKLSSNTVQYQVSPSFARTKSYMQALTAAIADLKKRTPVRLVKGSGYPFLYFTTSPDRGGRTGCGGNSATITLGGIEKLPAKSIQGYIVHETLHGLGFAHEQQRSDRNRYIKVVDRGVYNEFQSNNDIAGTSICGGKFKFESLMFNFQNAFKAHANVKPLGAINRSLDSVMAYSDAAGLWKAYGGKKSMSCEPPGVPTRVKIAAVIQENGKKEISVSFKFPASKNLGGYRIVIAPAGTYTNCSKGMNYPRGKSATAEIVARNLDPKKRYTVGFCAYTNSTGVPNWLSSLTVFRPTVP